VPYFCLRVFLCQQVYLDYARTLREWNRRLDANLTQKLLAKDFPTVGADAAAFDAFMRKWRYFFAYAGAGFIKGYITCHMLSFVREVRILLRSCLIRRLHVSNQGGAPESL
jgi:cyclopropane fatty-acyl-phospholipid synthase-like methyltransferase